jgi:hypothetical protein
LILNNKHCIFKRFSALNDPFGGQNGQFNEMDAWRVQIGITYPDMSGMIKVKGGPTAVGGALQASLFELRPDKSLKVRGWRQGSYKARS